MTKLRTSKQNLAQTVDQLITYRLRDPGPELIWIQIINLVYQTWLRRTTLAMLSMAGIAIAVYPKYPIAYIVYGLGVLVLGILNRAYLRSSSIAFFTLVTASSAIATQITASVTNPTAANLVTIAITSLITSLSMTTAYVIKPTAQLV